MSRRTSANLVTFTLVSGLFLAWAVNSIVSIDRLNQPYHLKGHFASSVGLLSGSEVDYLGVTFGSVTGVRREPGGVLVAMKIDHGKRIPAGSVAHIFRKTVLGEQYIDFNPPDNYSGRGPYYAADTVIDSNHTTVPLEFSELLRSAGRLVASIPPDAVQTLVHEAATGLAGRADALRSLIDASDRISQTLAARTATLDRLATDNTRLTHEITDHRASLGQAITDLRQLAASLRNARGDTSILLDRGSQLLGQTADLVAHHVADLDCDLKTLELVTDVTTTPANQAGLRTVLELTPAAFDDLADASQVVTGPTGATARYVRVGLILNPTYHPAPLFVPPKQLPAVAPVRLCASTLTATGGDYVPASVTSSASPGQLAGTGGYAALTLALALVGGSLVVRRALPDLRSPE